MLGRGVGHDATDPTVAGIEDVVEALCEQFGGFFDAALDHRNRAAVEVLRHEHCQGGARRGGDLARLHDHGIASRDRPHERREGEHQRVVPGGNDERNAEGFEDHLGRSRLHDEGCGDSARAHPLRQVRERVLDLAQQKADLGDLRLNGSLAEVGVQRGFEVCLALGEHVAHALELLATPLFASREALPEAVSQPGYDR